MNKVLAMCWGIIGLFGAIPDSLDLLQLGLISQSAISCAATGNAVCGTEGIIDFFDKDFLSFEEPEEVVF